MTRNPDLQNLNAPLEFVNMTTSPITAPRYVAYYRVSTDKQGRSGLGMEAQTQTVKLYAERNGGEIIATFQEVESGKKADRPELEKALALCRQKKAVLLIAKLDRLSRNVAFIANLMESGAEFIACDMPQANRLTLHIMAAMAEHEREAISKRTKEGLAVAKARGTILGRRDADTQDMADQRRKQAAEFRATVYPTIKQMKDRGMTLTAIALNLNQMRVKTCNNRAWYASTVRQLLNTEAEATV